VLESRHRVLQPARRAAAVRERQRPVVLQEGKALRHGTKSTTSSTPADTAARLHA
jgi:hypothetical protein